MLSSYSEVYNFGHRCLDGIFDNEVIVEEKIDGSQFSFGRIDGTYFCRSKGKDQTYPTDKMFAIARANTENRPLHEGWTYRGEYLAKPKHNTLCYDRVPNGNVIVYDIDCGNQHYLLPIDKEMETIRIGLECVPLLFKGKVSSMDEIKAFLTLPSILGGNIEGVVIKSYDKYAPDKKVLMAKLVREEFKEKHNKEWKKSNPSGGDKVTEISQYFCTPARWEKSIQHLRDNGNLQGDVTDIGNLIKEIQVDIQKECADEIKDMLWKWAWPHICRATTRGFPEWYKAKLVNDITLQPSE
jgi:hypothetical protein